MKEETHFSSADFVGVSVADNALAYVSQKNLCHSL